MSANKRILHEAEGYLELDMAQQALDVLARMKEPGTFRGQKLYMTGKALQSLKRYSEAIAPLEQAADILPSNIDVWLTLGWCYKRMARLDAAIAALERAEEVEPDQAVIQYNLACYWSLAGNKQRAIAYLSRAFALAPDYRTRIDEESDFDPIRSDPEFRALTRIIV